MRGITRSLFCYTTLCKDIDKKYSIQRTFLGKLIFCFLQVFTGINRSLRGAVHISKLRCYKLFTNEEDFQRMTGDVLLLQVVSHAPTFSPRVSCAELRCYVWI